MEERIKKIIKNINNIRFEYFTLENKLSELGKKLEVTSTQIQILLLLENNSGISMTKLSNIYHAKVSTLHGVLTRMKGQKLINMIKDTRVVNVFITQKGKKIIENIKDLLIAFL